MTSPLKLGDKMPDIYLGEFLEDSTKKMKVSDLKGSLVILDFWETWCSSCIAAMPKMDSLQKEFGNRIKIILVTRNDRAKVSAIFKKGNIRRPDLPLVINDSFLRKLFPYNTVPHHVWIDQNGIVKFITDGYNATG